MLEIFKASVQYNDMKGSSAADKSDMNTASKWLQDNGKMNDDEFIVGISMYVGENHGSHRDPISVTFLISELSGYDNIPEMLEASGDTIKVRKVSEQMNITDFFALFKRFNVTLSNQGIIENKSIAEM